MKTDIEIAQEAKMEHIAKVAGQLGITEDELELYGKYKAKLSDELMDRVKDNPDGKLVLVTAINPTPAGEGKTTTSIGLAQAMGRLNQKAVLALREPSLGPCFGIKGGAAGGGYAQVVPMEDLNLHFTGDFHAITSANNLLAAMLDNHIQQGNAPLYRSPPGGMETLPGYERPGTEKYRGGSGQQDGRYGAGGSFCHHRSHGDHGGSLPGG